MTKSIAGDADEIGPVPVSSLHCTSTDLICAFRRNTAAKKTLNHTILHFPSLTPYEYWLNIVEAFNVGYDGFLSHLNVLTFLLHDCPVQGIPSHGVGHPARWVGWPVAKKIPERPRDECKQVQVPKPWLIMLHHHHHHHHSLDDAQISTYILWILWNLWTSSRRTDGPTDGPLGHLTTSQWCAASSRTKWREITRRWGWHATLRCVKGRKGVANQSYMENNRSCRQYSVQ